MTQTKKDYFRQILQEEKEELQDLKLEMAQALAAQGSPASNMGEASTPKLRFRERLADRVTTIGGTWTFLLIFGAVLFGWVLLNSYMMVQHPFDPYPYIFLNLILSALAALQAPIILMSQNRQEARDRLRDENDYRVNLKTETEVRVINDKLDRLVSRQWQRLLRIQELQLEMMEDLPRKSSSAEE